MAGQSGELNGRNFRGGSKAQRGPPIPGTGADIKVGALVVVIPFDKGLKQPDQKVEGKILPPMGMAR